MVWLLEVTQAKVYCLLFSLFHNGPAVEFFGLQTVPSLGTKNGHFYL